MCDDDAEQVTRERRSFLGLPREHRHLGHLDMLDTVAGQGSHQKQRSSLAFSMRDPSYCLCVEVVVVDRLFKKTDKADS
jgi:hypothetical protein